MNSPIDPSQAPADGRFDERAERVKQATSEAVHHARDTVDRVADQVESRLHEATDKAAHAANRAADRAEEAREHGREAYERGRDQADAWLETACDYVREKPIQSVAIALGAGWLLGRLLRR